MLGLAALSLFPLSLSLALHPRQNDYLNGSDPDGSACNLYQGNHETNPTSENFPGDFADPCIIEYGGKYYAFGTNNFNIGQNVPVAMSDNFATGWKNLNLTTVLPDPGNWTYRDKNGNANVWDPDVNYIVSRDRVRRSSALLLAWVSLPAWEVKTISAPCPCPVELYCLVFVVWRARPLADARSPRTARLSCTMPQPPKISRPTRRCTGTASATPPQRTSLAPTHQVWGP